MFGLQTVREWARYNDWADTRILESATGLPTEALERDFPIGLSTLRRTLLHIYNAEYVWRNRWQGRMETPWPSEDEAVSSETLLDRYRVNWKERDGYLDTLKSSDLAAVINYRDSRGTLYKAALGDMVLQGLVHSAHHRAQALNMLRHVGATLPKPGLDYIFMYGQQPMAEGAGLDVATLLRFVDYSDKTQARVLAAAGKLSDALLDQPFEMGVGTLRKTLLHIRSAEYWWWSNWTQGPGQPFPDLNSDAPIAEVARLYRETSQARTEYLRTLNDADLNRVVEGEPRPGVRRSFPLGVTILQLCNHGVHHRAQAANMLRRLGGEALDLDYMYSLRMPA